MAELEVNAQSIVFGNETELSNIADDNTVIKAQELTMEEVDLDALGGGADKVFVEGLDFTSPQMNSLTLNANELIIDSSDNSKYTQFTSNASNNYFKNDIGVNYYNYEYGYYETIYLAFEIQSLRSRISNLESQISGGA